MFKLSKNPTFKSMIVHSEPSEDPSKENVFEFIGVFKRMSTKQLRAMSEKKYKNQTEEVIDCLVGWEDIQDEDGNNYEYTKENVEAILEIYPGLNSSIITAFVENYNEAGRKKLIDIGKKYRKK